jgi:Protein of unknown function (DUF3443)
MRRQGKRRLLASLSIVIAVVLAGCGGSGTVSAGDSGGATQTPAAANVLPVSVSKGPSNAVNLLFTSVTVCVPGNSAACATIDHVQVDTGSSGLRIIASQLPLTLPQQTDGSGNDVAECAQFADGYAWGPVKIADVKIAGEEAAALPIQVIGDAAFATIPDNCSSYGPAENSVASFGANGVLGVGQFLQDCGSLCVSSAANGYYYPCPVSGGCLPSSSGGVLDLARQVANPVALFANDNNGVIIELPKISADGAAAVNGSLVFGIDTQTNNSLGNAQVFTTTAAQGTIITTYNNHAFHYSLFDSGSSAYFFTDNTIPVCPQSDPYAPGFYCPTTTQDLSAVIRGANGASATLNFSVADADKLAGNHPDYWAFNNLGAPNAAGGSNIFIWGLPVFFGRNVYTAIEGQTTSAGAGPFIAF